MAHEIFISHAVKDKVLADAVVDLLQLGLNLDVDTVFCSSSPGLGIPTGVNFVDHIKEKIQSPRAVVALITPNYFASQFCLCELGATWAMSHSLFPLVVSPMKFEDVKGVLTGVQLTALDSAEFLSELRDQLIKTLEVAGGKTARWESKRDAFLKSLPKLLKKLPVPSHISPAAHSKVVDALAESKEYIAELDEQVERLNALVADLTKAKDKKEVAAIKRTHLAESEVLDQHETKVRERLKVLPKCVSFVACKQLGLQEPFRSNHYKDPELDDALHTAKGNDLIEIDDSGYCVLNDRHPKIQRLIESYNVLSHFLESVSDELSAEFAEEHEMTLTLSNQEYWGFSLDERLAKMSF
ncbi:hypothetical protein PS673_02037 [Pseudomonas fluorescens]|uniref:TIR domain-containing protein n=1 Tax=Pseudomonas fluorescens TaxID=294 RepID=A0A5E6S6D2_PSEFL|nr:toll/interleukin-1 receptor domain-containing protein [Pseudomonas fluorescens]VVM76236.1 hypothetical protein PS673_02037 [Pseudomonas fluorescens]